MLLAIDIGNTAMKFGVFGGDELTSKFVIPTRRDYTHDELSNAIAPHLADAPEGVIFSSVVPELDVTVNELFLRGGLAPRQVTTSDDFGLTFNFSVEEAGTDRLVNSFAATELHGAPCIVIAFGTATTIDAVNKDKEHIGCLIAPGPKTTAKALELIASKLPEVEIAEPPNVVSTTTATAIQSGIFYSQIGLIETAIPHIQAEIGDKANVIATGGFAALFADKTLLIDHIEPDLTLLGLKMLYSRA
ncbi:MAG: type III pantothenate kinase [Acidobacteria bacterium]|nr:type III pantothenate kinase [Acidobacteriota bacterium]